MSKLPQREISTAPTFQVALILVLILSFCLLVTSALRGVYMLYPLLVMWVMLTGLLCRQGYPLASLLRMTVVGARKATPVIQILLLIGMVTASWLAAGTVPALVYYGTALIAHKLFILCAFLLSALVSVLTGTSFGTAGTMGVALMAIARSANMPLNLVGGAIIAGAFVGDRCSPLSSSAYLVAGVTRLPMSAHLRNMMRSSWAPLGLTALLYGGLSVVYPLRPTTGLFIRDLVSLYGLSLKNLPLLLSPAVAVLLLAVLRVNVKVAMAVSVGLGSAIALFSQQVSWLDLLHALISGYQPSATGPLQTILSGGGLLPMAKSTLVVALSTGIAGLLSGSRALTFINRWLASVRSSQQLQRSTIWVSILTNLFGCTQTIAIVLSAQIMEPHYQKVFKQTDMPAQANATLALTLADTAIVIAPLVPWNIAGLLPASILSIGPEFIPFAFYLYLLPLMLLIRTIDPSQKNPSTYPKYLH